MASMRSKTTQQRECVIKERNPQNAKQILEQTVKRKYTRRTQNDTSLKKSGNSNMSEKRTKRKYTRRIPINVQQNKCVTSMTKSKMSGKSTRAKNKQKNVKRAVEMSENIPKLMKIQLPNHATSIEHLLEKTSEENQVSPEHAFCITIPEETEPNEPFDHTIHAPACYVTLPYSQETEMSTTNLPSDQNSSEPVYRITHTDFEDIMQNKTPTTLKGRVSPANFRESNFLYHEYLKIGEQYFIFAKDYSENSTDNSATCTVTVNKEIDHEQADKSKIDITSPAKDEIEHKSAPEFSAMFSEPQEEECSSDALVINLDYNESREDNIKSPKYTKISTVRIRNYLKSTLESGPDVKNKDEKQETKTDNIAEKDQNSIERSMFPSSSSKVIQCKERSIFFPTNEQKNNAEILQGEPEIVKNKQKIGFVNPNTVCVTPLSDNIEEDQDLPVKKQMYSLYPLEHPVSVPSVRVFKDIGEFKNSLNQTLNNPDSNPIEFEVPLTEVQPELKNYHDVSPDFRRIETVLSGDILSSIKCRSSRSDINLISPHESRRNETAVSDDTRECPLPAISPARKNVSGETSATNITSHSEDSSHLTNFATLSGEHDIQSKRNQTNLHVVPNQNQSSVSIPEESFVEISETRTQTIHPNMSQQHHLFSSEQRPTFTPVIRPPISYYNPIKRTHTGEMVTPDFRYPMHPIGHHKYPNPGNPVTQNSGVGHDNDLINPSLSLVQEKRHEIGSNSIVSPVTCPQNSIQSSPTAGEIPNQFNNRVQQNMADNHQRNHVPYIPPLEPFPNISQTRSLVPYQNLISPNEIQLRQSQFLLKHIQSLDNQTHPSNQIQLSYYQNNHIAITNNITQVQNPDLQTQLLQNLNRVQTNQPALNHTLINDLEMGTFVKPVLMQTRAQSRPLGPALLQARVPQVPARSGLSGPIISQVPAASHLFQNGPRPYISQALIDQSGAEYRAENRNYESTFVQAQNPERFFLNAQKLPTPNSIQRIINNSMITKTQNRETQVQNSQRSPSPRPTRYPLISVQNETQNELNLPPFIQTQRSELPQNPRYPNKFNLLQAENPQPMYMKDQHSITKSRNTVYPTSTVIQNSDLQIFQNRPKDCLQTQYPEIHPNQKSTFRRSNKMIDYLRTQSKLIQNAVQNNPNVTLFNQPLNSANLIQNQSQYRTIRPKFAQQQQFPETISQISHYPHRANQITPFHQAQINFETQNPNFRQRNVQEAIRMQTGPPRSLNGQDRTHESFVIPVGNDYRPMITQNQDYVHVTQNRAQMTPNLTQINSNLYRAQPNQNEFGLGFIQNHSQLEALNRAQFEPNEVEANANKAQENPIDFRVRFTQHQKHTNFAAQNRDKIEPNKVQANVYIAQENPMDCGVGIAHNQDHAQLGAHYVAQREPNDVQFNANGAQENPKDFRDGFAQNQDHAHAQLEAQNVAQIERNEVQYNANRAQENPKDFRDRFEQNQNHAHALLVAQNVAQREPNEVQANANRVQDKTKNVRDSFAHNQDHAQLVAHYVAQRESNDVQSNANRAQEYPKNFRDWFAQNQDHAHAQLVAQNVAQRDPNEIQANINRAQENPKDLRFKFAHYQDYAKLGAHYVAQREPNDVQSNANRAQENPKKIRVGFSQNQDHAHPQLVAHSVAQREPNEVQANANRAQENPKDLRAGFAHNPDHAQLVAHYVAQRKPYDVQSIANRAQENLKDFRFGFAQNQNHAHAQLEAQNVAQIERNVVHANCYRAQEYPIDFSFGFSQNRDNAQLADQNRAPIKPNEVQANQTGSQENSNNFKFGYHHEENGAEIDENQANQSKVLRDLRKFRLEKRQEYVQHAENRVQHEPFEVQANRSRAQENLNNLRVGLTLNQDHVPHEGQNIVQNEPYEVQAIQNRALENMNDNRDDSSSNRLEVNPNGKKAEITLSQHRSEINSFGLIPDELSPKETRKSSHDNESNLKPKNKSLSKVVRNDVNSLRMVIKKI